MPTDYAKDIDRELKRVLFARARGETADLYRMLAYFAGFLKRDLHTNGRSTGKRFRPSLCLMIAEGYGAKNRALPVALAIELFHNFTLIHDDIADRDEIRRNQPTLWKLFGTNHALNAGDALLLLTAGSLERLSSDEKRSRGLRARCIETFLAVCEGQYMDFELSNDSPRTVPNISRYVRMTKKKTGVLVGLAAEAAGIVAKRSSGECKKLRSLGEALGLAFQIADDLRSVWSSKEKTGKDSFSDIREKKRMLPFLFALQDASPSARKRLSALYSSQKQLSDREVEEVRRLIDGTHARSRMMARLSAQTKDLHTQIDMLAVKADTKKSLHALVQDLIPECRVA